MTGVIVALIASLPVWLVAAAVTWRWDLRLVAACVAVLAGVCWALASMAREVET
jgi:hypothetical protein